MSPRRLLLVTLVLLSACGAVRRADVCTSSSRETCAELEAIAATLHTPEMNRRIDEARALK